MFPQVPKGTSHPTVPLVFIGNLTLCPEQDGGALGSQVGSPYQWPFLAWPVDSVQWPLVTPLFLQARDLPGAEMSPSSHRGAPTPFA